MENLRRRTFPTTVKTAPTEAELDRMLFELVDKFAPDTEADPETRAPTDAELRARCAELGYPVPARNPDRVWIRNLFPAMTPWIRRGG